MPPEVVYEPLFPWILLWASPALGSLVIVAGMIAGVRREAFYGSVSVASIGVSAALSAVAASTVYSSGAIYAGRGYQWIPWIDVTLGVYVDGLAAVMSLVVSWISLAIAVYSVRYMSGDWGYGRYFLFFTFFVASMMLLVVADNLVLFFIGWEGTGIASYALISHWYTDEKDKWVGRPGRLVLGTPMFFEPSHSGLRAILFTRVGDLALILGISVLYHFTGTFNIYEISLNAPDWIRELSIRGVLAPLMLLITIGALAKSAQLPFHEWLVTAMTGPTPISALIHAATMVKAGIYLFLRLTPILASGAIALLGSPEFGPAVEALRDYFLLIGIIGALTAFALATMALVSDELKLILAYSTASQIGYMFLAAASAGMLLGKIDLAGVASAVYAGLSHLMSHAVFKAALFLAAGWVIHVAHSRFIDDMGGYSRAMRLTALSFWLAGLSLAGIPPLSGFYTKDLVLENVIHASSLLYVIGSVTAILTAAYTIRLVVRVFHGPPGGGGSHSGEAPPAMLVPYLALALSAALMGLAWPGIGGLLEVYGERTLSLDVGARVEPSITLEAVALTSGIVGASLIVAWIYAYSGLDLMRAVESRRLLRALHGFLYDRWYMNPLLYLVIYGPLRAILEVLALIDLAIDYLYHAATPLAGSRAANALRGLHRGRTDYYMALYLVFIAIVLGATYALLR